MAMRKIKKGDEVIVIAGKDKGKRGTVQKIVSQNKVLVEGVNLVKKHMKPNPHQQIEGGIVEKEMPIDQSNLAIYNSDTQKKDKVGLKILENGEKVRYYKSTGEVIER